MAAVAGSTPNHLKRFSPSTLAQAFARSGFERPVMAPACSHAVETGKASLSPLQERRLRRVIERGNRGNVIRAVAYAGAPARERAVPAPAPA